MDRTTSWSLLGILSLLCLSVVLGFILGRYFEPIPRPGDHLYLSVRYADIYVYEDGEWMLRTREEKSFE